MSTTMSRSRLRAMVFALVSAVLLAAVGLTMGEFRFDDARRFHAIFANSGGLNPGDEVRAAGVRIGKVQDVVLRDDQTVRVTFTAARAVPVSRASNAVVRYKSLTGVKYLEIQRGPRADEPMPAGGTVPLSNTNPGLDLDEVFNSFKPLVRGLSPQQINQLSGSIIEVFQGQGGAIDSLLANLGQLTSTLADRDEVIGQLIDNFKTVLGTVDRRGKELDATVVSLRRLVGGLSKDRVRLVDSIADAGDLARDTSGFLAALRPDLRETVQQSGAVADALNTDLPLLDKYLTALPVAAKLVGRLGAYGSFYSFYICSLSVTFSAPGGGETTTDPLTDTTPRCQLPKKDD